LLPLEVNAKILAQLHFSHEKETPIARIVTNERRTTDDTDKHSRPKLSVQSVPARRSYGEGG
jgi:hypothetical protein